MSSKAGYAGEQGSLLWAGVSSGAGLDNVHTFNLTENAPAIYNTAFSPTSGATSAVAGLSTFTGSVKAWAAPDIIPRARTIASGVFTTHPAGFPNSGGAVQSLTGNWLITRVTIDETVNNQCVSLAMEVQSVGYITIASGS